MYVDLESSVGQQSSLSPPPAVSPVRCGCDLGCRTKIPVIERRDERNGQKLRLPTTHTKKVDANAAAIARRQPLCCCCRPQY